MPIDLDELERLAKEATPLPWVGRGNHIFCADRKRLVYVEAERALDLQTAAYIVTACNAVPELIAENRALRERVRELEIREVDYIEERDALLSTKYALERQRDWLAQQVVFFKHKDIGSSQDIAAWIERAEKAAKEAGE